MELQQMNAEIAIKALAALAQEHRLAVFRLLVQAGPAGLAAGALSDQVGLPASSMSFHLAQLTNAGLATQQRRSRSILYFANYGAMNGLLTYLTENCCAGADCSGAPAAQPESENNQERDAA
jgi:DNA-binding transcriptional ArsR family regulator